MGWRMAMKRMASSSICAFERVDLLVLATHALACFDIASDQRLDAVGDLGFDQAAHFQAAGFRSGLRSASTAVTICALVVSWLYPIRPVM